MAAMPDIEADARRAAGWLENRLPRRHGAAPAPSFIPNAHAAPTAPASQENHMSLGTELHRVAAVIENYGEDGIAIFEAVASNPETRAAVIVLARLAGIPLTSGTITAGMGSLTAIENVWHTAQQALAAGQQPPAGGTGAQGAQGAHPQVI